MPCCGMGTWCAGSVGLLLSVARIVLGVRTPCPLDQPVGLRLVSSSLVHDFGPLPSLRCLPIDDCSAQCTSSQSLNQRTLFQEGQIQLFVALLKISITPRSKQSLSHDQGTFSSAPYLLIPSSGRELVALSGSTKLLTSFRTALISGTL